VFIGRNWPDLSRRRCSTDRCAAHDPGTVDNQLTAAKKVARLVLENLVGDLDEPTDLP